MNATEFYQDKRRQDYASKYSDEDILEPLSQAHAGARDGFASATEVNAYSTLALAMLAYNESIDRRWQQADGLAYKFDYPLEG